jgi:hypothetical protein
MSKQGFGTQPVAPDGVTPIAVFSNFLCPACFAGAASLLTTTSVISPHHIDASGNYRDNPEYDFPVGRP